MIGRLMDRFWAWLRGLSKGWLLAGASVIGVVIVVGSVAMYRVYDYVQHDNNFCMSCHLMANPFDRFQQSAHRGLGCKACHRPNIIQRSKMGLTQILEMPDSISQHAEVPKEICGECHVRGNPKEWKLIANTVGHRLHLESKDPALKNIECVDCHGAGIHEFAPVDKTCGKVGCHERVAVKLGKMSNHTIHCASCHDFTRPVARAVRGDSLKREITPRGNDCLSCHAMRQRVGESFPVDEPHNGVCGTCHNPHEQKVPADAVRSCTQSGCHERVDTLSAMHRALAAGVVQNCTRCHAAHTWKARADACTSCHSLDQLDSGSRPIKQIDAAPARMSVLGAALGPTRFALRIIAQIGRPNTPFRHTPHRGLACTSCHESDSGHGVLKLRTAADCSGCHHAQNNTRQCTSCHRATRLSGTYTQTFESTTSVAKAPVRRTLAFKHAWHNRLECKSCHTSPPHMDRVAGCNNCHADHHTEARNCTACHTDVQQVEAHNRSVHLTCAGSGCHKKTVNAVMPVQRSACLTCHADKKDHEPSGDCASCHMIPKASSARATK